MLDRLEGLGSVLNGTGDPAISDIWESASKLTKRLEACNGTLFRKVRVGIRSRSPADEDFLGLLRENAGLVPVKVAGQNEPG